MTNQVSPEAVEAAARGIHGPSEAKHPLAECVAADVYRRQAKNALQAALPALREQLEAEEQERLARERREMQRIVRDERAKREYEEENGWKPLRDRAEAAESQLQALRDKVQEEANLQLEEAEEMRRASLDPVGPVGKRRIARELYQAERERADHLANLLNESGEE